MNKFVFFFFLVIQFSFGQKLHHQVIASQGASVTISNGYRISQSVAQVNGAIGNYQGSKLLIGQGYIQSYGIAKNISPIESEVSMILYPNPVVATATFKFSSDVGTTARLYLFDSRGRLIYNQPGELQQNSLTQDLSDIAEGIYFAKIETLNHVFSTKIIKTK